MIRSKPTEITITQLNPLPNGNGEGKLQLGGKDIPVPVYTVRKKDGDEEWDIMCSHEEAQQACKDQGLVIVPKFPAIVAGVGNTHANSKTSDGWKDHLKRIKQGSGSGNTIDV